MTERIRQAGRGTFASLSVPNYRLYLGGQSISLVGTWMQMTAQAWLVLTLTDSSTTLGLIVALQALPVLLLGPYGGVIADRVNKLRLMTVLQAVMGVQALVLGLLTVTGTVRLWQIGVLALLLGLNNAFESPARQSFMLELVGPEHLRNAVTLNSVVTNVARAVGPAIAGIMIATTGTGVAFLLNAVSFIAVVYSLLRLDHAKLQPSPPAGRARGQVREGFGYVRHTPELGVPLLMMALVGMLAYEFQVSLPVMAKTALDSNAAGFGFMTAAMGAGAVVGGLLIAARGAIGLKQMIGASAALGLTMSAAALAPNLPLEIAAMAFVGGASIAFMSIGNAGLQINSAPTMRGRVMSLWFVAFRGSTPIGGPIVGWTMAVAGARAGLGLGAITCLLVAVIGLVTLGRGLSVRAHASPA